jgi:hypothetical protein
LAAPLRILGPEGHQIGREIKRELAPFLCLPSTFAEQELLHDKYTNEEIQAWPDHSDHLGQQRLSFR